MQALDASLPLSEYGHSAWRVQDGMFGGAPVSIAQTTDGYVWIGTRSGLVRFDGVKFVPFSVAAGEGLRSPRVMALQADRDGSLWIGIELEFNFKDDAFQLRVCDDGRGIDPRLLRDGAQPDHFGLQIMRERSERIGARLTFIHRDLRGTEVKLVVPAAAAYQGPSAVE